MKHIVLKAIACFLCFSSCNNLQEDLSDFSSDEELLPIQFRVDLQQEVLPFPKTKTMPQLDIPEPTAKGQEGENVPSVPDAPPETFYKQIDYLVYKKGISNELIKHKCFKLGDPDFSIIYDSLPRGDYHFCFLAHSDENISIQEETAEFQKVSDTFHLYLTQTIQPGEKLIKNISLRRIISKIEFVATDIVTNDLSKFKIDVQGYQNKIDLTTGLGISDNISYSSTYSFRQEDYGKINFTHSLFTFVPANNIGLNVNLLASNKKGENTRSREITDIQVQQNHIIRYTGQLYIPPKSNDTFTIDIVNEGNWAGTTNNNLAD